MGSTGGVTVQAAKPCTPAPSPGTAQCCVCTRVWLSETTSTMGRREGHGSGWNKQPCECLPWLLCGQTSTGAQQSPAQIRRGPAQPSSNQPEPQQLVG